MKRFKTYTVKLTVRAYNKHDALDRAKAVLTCYGSELPSLNIEEWD